MTRTAIESKSAVLDDSPFYGDLAPDPATITGLTFGYTAGVFVDGDSFATISAGTEALTDDATNIVFRDGAIMGSAVSGSESNEVKRIYRITTASGVITVIEDIREAVS